MTLFPNVIDLLKKNDAADISVSAGGIIPDEDVPRLKNAGVAGVFGPGTPTNEIVDFIKGTCS
jgi:methylmalonyl-CoA mutase C-terminal domain/subunit